MLIKKELQNLQLSPSPTPTEEIRLTAGAAVHHLPRCRNILAVDVYENQQLIFRFFSDGKNFITWRARSDVQGWTKRDPFITENIRYHSVMTKPCSMEKISHVLGIKPLSRNVLGQVEECVAQFIARYRRQKKEKAMEAKYRLMDQHLDMFPVYPFDLDEFCENHVFHKSIVYLSKLKKGRRWGRCMHCGRRFLLDRSVKPGSEGICPKCGASVRFRGEWVEKPVSNKAKICIPYLVDGQVLLRYTHIKRHISPRANKPEYEYSDFFLNLFLEKNGRQKAYAYYWRQYPYYWAGWSRLRNSSICYSDTYVYTENLPEIFGKEYCHVDLQAGLKSLRRPIDFVGILRNLRDIPQAEYLFKAGLPGLAAGLPPFSPRSASFAELTGISKQYLPILRETQAMENEIKLLAASKKWVPFEVFRQLCALNLDYNSLNTMRSIMEYNRLGRILRYLQSQKKSKKTFANLLGLYRDYLDMAKSLGSNMKKKAILEPRDLKAQHDLMAAQLAEQKREKENSLLPLAIQDGLYWWAQEYASEKYQVVYPQTRDDFINEGISLNHCVGSAGYYDRHVLGRQMVFFIRQTPQPDKPLYTTEIDMDEGRIRQLYGFSDTSVPKDVRAFTEGFVRAAMRWRSAQRIAG